jgi:SHS2 domain-containing protein
MDREKASPHLGYNRVMDYPNAGYFEIEHTADWALTVFAPDLTGLLEQAARGMYILSGVILALAPRGVRAFIVKGYDPEHLLVKFLSELLFMSEEEGIGFDSFDLCLAGLTLEARVTYSPIESQQKEIKAVTYHNLHIQPSTRGLEATIVFDV